MSRGYLILYPHHFFGSIYHAKETLMGIYFAKWKWYFCGDRPVVVIQPTKLVRGELFEMRWANDSVLNVLLKAKSDF